MQNKRLINLFTELVKIDSVSSNERDIAKHIISFLKQVNQHPSNNKPFTIFTDNSNEKTNSNTGNVICRIGTGGDFLLLSHMDTVESTKLLNPILTEDRIMTDGKTILGSDNRAGIAAILYALEKLVIEKTPIKDFTIAFTTCEETTLGGSTNLELADELKYGFVFDSSYRPGKYIYSSCGAIAFEIEIQGKASHSGISPEKGINSILIAAKAISDLRIGRLDDETTLNIGLIQGGSAVNVVPEWTKINGEIRSFNKDKILIEKDNLLSVFDSRVKEFNGSYKFNYNWDFHPYTHSTEDEIVGIMEKAMLKSGITPNPTISFGGSDANSLNGRGIKAVNIGIGAQNPHSAEEFILIEDLAASAEIARHLIINEQHVTK